MPRETLTEKDVKQLNYVWRKTTGLLQWWADFTYTIRSNGRISPKQRQKLFSFNLDREIQRTYGCKFLKAKRIRWEYGLDHEDMIEYHEGL